MARQPKGVANIRIETDRPGDPDAWASLSRQIAAVHADVVLSRLRALRATPAQQREALRLIREERGQADR